MVNTIDTCTSLNSSAGSSTNQSISTTSSSVGGNSEKSKGNPTTLNQPIEIPIDDLFEYSKYIPLRLNDHERGLLQVLESSLNVSEYTDNVDVALRRGNKTRRILDGILEACNISTGLAVCGMADDYSSTAANPLPESDRGRCRRKLRITKKKSMKKKTVEEEGNASNNQSGSLAGRDPKDNAAFFQEMFEIGRRNKVLNPSKMRDTYGKLMHLLQDAQNPTVARSLGFSLYKEMIMVRPFLESFEADLAKRFLTDPRVPVATMYIQDKSDVTGQKIPREIVQNQVQQKNYQREALAEAYDNAVEKITKKDIFRVLDSISDAISVIRYNLKPVRRMLALLEQNFHPSRPESPYSLQLSSTFSFPKYSFSSPSHAPKLSHSHSTQYTFVWQTLKLWCEVEKNMHRLWVCADDDLLSTNAGYQLWNTGQGLNRVQNCPKVGKVMRSLLSSTQQAAGAPWVGLSVIHLGDRDVPNALVFIDKYTQIPRILYPIIDFIDALPSFASDKGISRYIEDQFGSTHDLKMTLLADFFKHGFDGSGDDGGSCIDGRLTSSWNWTSRIVKKNYYYIFMLAGFQGFDGDFK